MFIFVLEPSLSEMNNKPCFSAYEGQVYINKSNRVSGDYHKIQIAENTQLLELIKRYGGCIIDKNKFVIELENIQNVIHHPNVIVGYEDRHKIHIIKSSGKVNFEFLNVEKNKMYIVKDTSVLRVDEKSEILICDGKTIVVYKDEILFIDATIDKKIFKNYILSKRPKKEITKNELFSGINIGDPCDICTDTNIYVNLRFIDGYLIMIPYVLYCGNVGRAIDSKRVIANGRLYLRDYLKESDIQKFFSKAEVIADGEYRINEINAYDWAKKMIEKGYLVVLNGKKVRTEIEPFKNVRISSGIDWFELDGNISFDNTSVEVSELLGYNSPLLIEGENSVIIVPDNINQLLKKTDLNGHIEKTLENYTHIIENSNNYFDKVNLVNVFQSNQPLNIPSELFDKLFEYQEFGARWMKNLIMHNYGCCLADDMGLGKTIQILTLLIDEQVVEKFHRVMIIVPKILMGNWIKESEKFVGEYLPISLFYGKERTIKKSDLVVLTTYETVANSVDELLKYQWDLVVLDEAQRVKNINSKTRKIIKENFANSTIIAATGTPYENNLLELWSIMDLVNHNSLGNISTYKDRYVNNNEKLSELSEKLSPFILRRKKEDVLMDLPIKSEKNIYCVMNTKQTQLYNGMLLRIKKDLLSEDNVNAVRMKALSGLTYLREICCHPNLINERTYKECSSSIKLEIIEELVKEALRDRRKIVLYSQYTRFLKIIAHLLDSKGVNYCYIDGNTKERQKEIEKFENEDVLVFLISLKAGGVGINLTSACRMVICDPWWNPAVERQAEDRIYRIGQQEDVIIYRLIAKGTIEEKIQELKQSKDLMGAKLLDGLMNISDMDIDSILKLYEE